MICGEAVPTVTGMKVVEVCRRLIFLYSTYIDSMSNSNGATSIRFWQRDSAIEEKKRQNICEDLSI